MRTPIVQLAVVYGAGLWAGLVFLTPVGIIWIVGAAVGTAALWPGWRVLLCATAVMGFATGASRAALESGACRQVWKRGRVAVSLRMHDRPGPRGTTSAHVSHSAYGCKGDLRVRVDAGAVGAGERVLAVGQYRGGGVLRIEHIRRLDGPRAWRSQLRDAIGQRVNSLYGERAGVVEALVLGRRDNLDPAVRQRFADAGLAHVLAISGLHVGVIAAWLLLLARWLVGRRWAWLVSAVAVWLYVAILGFPAPATRAAAFVGILGVSRTRQRHPPPGSVLAVAMLLVLAVDPAAASSVGTWLSAAAVVGTRAGAVVLPRLRLLGASLGATVATAPITALVFGAVAPVGVVANLAAIPLAGVAVPGVFASLLLGGVPAAGTGLALAGIEWTATYAAALPAGHVCGAPGLRFAAPWLLLLAGVAWIQMGRPSWSRVRRWVLSLAATGSWMLAILPVAGHRNRPGELAIHFLAVGQGDAIALRTPAGSWILIDGGPRTAGSDAGRSVVVPFLRRRGVEALATVVVTHADADHLGGVPYVVREMSLRLALDPGQAHGTNLYAEYLESLDRVGVDWHAARAGDVMSLDSIKFEVLHPAANWLATHLEPNDNSVVLRITHGCFSTLLTGDVGWPAESALVPTLEPVDLLKVGHHGAPGGTTDALLDAADPRAAVISVGRNRFGHPAAATLDRLRSRGIALFRTDQGGTVTVRSDGRYFQVSQGVPENAWEVVTCLIGQLLRSSDSSSSKRNCIRRPPVSLPSCSTT